MVQFHKYQGTGNDFIMVDNRSLEFYKDKAYIRKLCDRRFGIGADGLILLENTPEADFKMVYYNADGGESSMCGNGGRCIVAFAAYLEIITYATRFIAADGLHEATLKNGKVKLKMSDVAQWHTDGDDFVLNTGSPHYVRFVEDAKNTDVPVLGNKIRNSATYCAEGINVNFAEKRGNNELFVRTYERGVEDETYSCGTGATAAALMFLKDHNADHVTVEVPGGRLFVYAKQNGAGFSDIWLEGPAAHVFTGFIN